MQLPLQKRISLCDRADSRRHLGRQAGFSGFSAEQYDFNYCLPRTPACTDRKGPVIVCGCFISAALWEYRLFIRFSPWRDPQLRHFAGYSSGISRKKASTIFWGTAFCKGNGGNSADTEGITGLWVHHAPFYCRGEDAAKTFIPIRRSRGCAKDMNHVPAETKIMNKRHPFRIHKPDS